MKVCTARQVARLRKGKWVNLDDLKTMADGLDQSVGRLHRVTSGNCSHVANNVALVLSYWVGVLREELK